ncbi:fasciclin domain-containing protein [Spirosoma sp. KCTC 42546]|uniref:fasciclin domain-containing protein n=1 Tax=Spirosoma sp. KCTC 42546 TaxID=2520506 RepID=UPI001159F7D9|nr:fasciclin domain-containing protein [Spirosoma sp. KCTC 42546]QDK81378.1 fasciclin domain-containing protein [Spirosoma sp. KCTC 42546]
MSIHHYASTGRSWSLLLTLLTALIISFSSCKEQEDTTPKLSTITELINTGSKFTLLKAALVRTGLDGTLSQPGTYTVFAPTDDAFKLFGYGDVATVNAAPVETLKAVLQYHVLGTRLESSSIPVAVNTAQQTLIPTAVLYTSKVLSGTSTTSSSTKLSINGAHVLQADGQASNGVIYAIDRILIPPVLGNVVTTLQNSSLLFPTVSFKLLQAAVTKAGVGAILTGPGPITVFAPTDAAFKAVGYDSAMIAKAPVGILANILSYHVLDSRTYTPLITNGSSLTTLQGGTLTAGISTTALTVTGKGNANTASNIIGADISATNGVVHIIDRLLIP